MPELDDHVAIVTGGASGLGAATAAVLRRAGAHVVVLDRVLDSVPGEHVALRCDITDGASVDSAVASVVERFGRLDILVNNAGIGAIGDVTDNSEDEWREVFDVNVLGAMRMSRAALPYLAKSDHAAIVNVASVVALIGVPNRALYSATKGALISLTLAMAADHLSQGVRVNAVAPGTADTPWVGRLVDAAADPRGMAEALRARQPLGRLIAPEEVAQAVAYLASPLSASTTGTVLQVDGGMGSLRLS